MNYYKKNTNQVQQIRNFKFEYIYIKNWLMSKLDDNSNHYETDIINFIISIQKNC